MNVRSLPGPCLAFKGGLARLAGWLAGWLHGTAIEVRPKFASMRLPSTKQANSQVVGNMCARVCKAKDGCELAQAMVH